MVIKFRIIVTLEDGMDCKGSVKAFLVTWTYSIY